MKCFLLVGIGINITVYAPQKALCFMPLGNMSQVGCNQLGATFQTISLYSLSTPTSYSPN